MIKNLIQPTTLVEILRHRAQNQPNQTAYTFLKDGEMEEVSLTYAQLDQRVRAIAVKLQSLVTPGERALLLYPAGLSYIAAFFGCLYAGVIAVPTYPPRRNRSDIRLQTIVQDAQAKIVLTQNDIFSNLTEHLTHTPELKNLHWLVTDNLTAEFTDTWQTPSIDSETLAFLQYTSGSTGTPKGVMVSHGNLLYNAEMFRQGFGNTENTIGVGWLPLFHDMGLIGNVLQPLYVGCSIVLMSPMAFLQKPFRWLQAISRYHASSSAGPNFAYDLCVQKITPEQRAKLDLSYWEVAGNGAETIRAETLEQFSHTFEPCGFRREAFYPCYGMAETTLIISGGLKTAPPVVYEIDKASIEQHQVKAALEGESTHKIVGCGQTWLDQKILIVDPETFIPCSEQQVGEIWVSGQNVACGYWNRPEETEQTFHAYLADTGDGPFLRTGDLGFLKNGELFVTGRLKDIIIVRGRNYYPQDIELTVEKSHPALNAGSCAAFSVEKEGEERLVVAQEVERTALRKLNVDEIVNTIRQAVSSLYELQVYAVLLLKTATIPKTSSGKIQRHACRAGFLDGTLKTVASKQQYISIKEAEVVQSSHTITPETIQAWLLTKISQHLKIAVSEIDIRQPLAVYGLDSITAVNLSGELETWLERPVSPTLVYDYPNIEALSQHLGDGLQTDKKTPTRIQPKTVMEDIAIVGIACRFPGGAKDSDTFWQLLREGVDAISVVPASRWDVNAFYDPNLGTPGKMNTRWGGFLDEVATFDPQFFGISPREAESMDPQQRLLLEVSWEALENAGLAAEHLAGSQTGVFIGISTNDYSRLHTVLLGNNVDAYSGTGNALCIAANRLSYFLDLHGPSKAIDTACSSSLVAVHDACQSLRQRECNLALVGGVNLILSPDLTITFSAAQMLSPLGRCKTFDADADGYVRGEGCGIVVLKRLSDAVKDSDNILAVIKGTAMNQDGRSNGLTAPNGPAQQAVIRQALANAEINASEINYVEAHGTGTSLGDPIELNALKEVLMSGRVPEQPCYIGSVKTNIGHLEAAAGIAGLIKTALALQHQEIPPLLHLKTLNPHIAIADTALSIPTELTLWSTEQKLAGVSSFGFGGTNAHVVLSSAPALSIKVAEVERPKHLLTLSAQNEAALIALANAYYSYLKSHPTISIADVCFTANTGRSHFDHRLAVVADSPEQLKEQLSTFVDDGKTVEAVKGKLQSGKAPKIAFLFTGQGSQYVGMGRVLYQTLPTFRRAIDHCDEILRSYLEKPLLEVLYSLEEQTLLDETAYTQPALFALEYALAKLWQSWGIKPDVVMGHSVGEYVAACIAGVFSLEEGLKLIAARGQLMQTLCDKGDMLVLSVDESKAAEIIQPYAPDVSIAAINGPENVVISGKHETIDTIMAALSADENINTKLLPVSHAFHSSMMEPMLAEFERIAASVTYAKPSIPLCSNVTGQLVTDEIATPTYWCRHVRQPVRFAASMETLYQHGFQTFLEIGPKPSLLGMARQCLPDEVGTWLVSLREGQDDWQPLLQSLGELYVHGVPIDWSGFDKDYPRRRLQLPTYPFQRQRYWIERATTQITPQTTRSQSIHPLLGQRLILPGNEEIRFEAQIGTQSPAYLEHHRVFQTTILPATAFLEMVLAAGNAVFKSEPLISQDIVIEQALILSENEVKTVQVLLIPEGTTTYAFQIFSLTIDKDNEEPTWTRHVSGKILLGQPQANTVNLADWQAQCTEEIAISDYYQQYRDELEIDYGPSFQALSKLWKHPAGKAIGQIQLPKSLILDELLDFQLHPVLLDASFQVLGAIFPEKHKTYVPVALEQLHLYRRGEFRLWATATMRPIGEEPQIQTADLHLLTEQGQLIAEVKGMKLQAVTRDALLGTQESLQNWLYEIQWQAQASKATTAIYQGTGKNWLIFADNLGIGKELAALFREKGEKCTLVYQDKAYEQIDEQYFKLNPLGFEGFQKLLETVSCLRGIIHCWSLDSVGAETDLDTANQRGCGSTLHLVQALNKADFSEPPALWLVTQGAVPIPNPQFPIPNIAQSPLWGMGKVIALEHPELNCVRVDLEPETKSEIGAQALLAEISSKTSENQIAFRDNTRYVARLVRYHQPELQNGLDIPHAPSYQLQIAKRGTLENLKLEPTTRRQPNAGEIEIRVHASGLNFRDVLNALDLYPGDAGSLGGECAGKITTIGEGVEGFEIGDPVIAIVPGSFSQYVTINAAMVAPKPEKLSFEEAATIPVVFLTAYYTLHQLAKISAGDRVLIHAATGGVGQAAIQLAQLVGAEVFGTASPHKWAFLKSLGVEHILNSRTLDFADQIMAITKGQGVDIVLNSLTGEGFIPKSLSVLHSGGRFLEMGKSGIWQPKQVAQLKPDISYFIVDLVQTCQEQPTLIQTMFGELMLLFKAGHLKPLARKIFPITEAISAFRYMQQAKHIGKIVVTLPTTQMDGSVQLHDDSTYLITGGLGGLGLQVADFLVKHGAKHLVLIGRSAASATVKIRIEKLEQAGAEIFVAGADVSEKKQLAQVLANIDQSLPPLRGIIHAAGILEDGVLSSQNWERFARVLAPKVQGAWNLHTLTQHKALDFFILFSSAASLFGSIAQANYAAANTFLDALAYYRQAQGLTGMSINWGVWSEIGLAAKPQVSKQMQLKGVGSIAPQQGLQILAQLFSQPVTQVGVIPIKGSQFLRQWEDLPFFSQLKSETQAKPTIDFVERLKNLDSVKEQRDYLIAHVQSQVAKVLGFESSQPIDPQKGFFDLGMDSLTAVELKNSLQNSLGCSLPSTLLFKYPTMEALMDYIANDILALESPTADEPVIEAIEESSEIEIVAQVQQLSDEALEALIDQKLENLG